jgi:hypothetical protein
MAMRQKYRKKDGDGIPHKSRVRRNRDETLDQAALQEGFQFRRSRDLNAKLYDDEDDGLSTVERGRKQFKLNMEYLVCTYNISLPDLANEIGVEYRWLRRIVSQGLARKVDRLDRLARHFGLPNGDYLWATDIERFLPAPPPKPEQLGTLKQKINWSHAQQLLELLETGQHEYLKGLIDQLHKTCLSNPATTSASEREKADPPNDGTGAPVEERERSTKLVTIPLDDADQRDHGKRAEAVERQVIEVEAKQALVATRQSATGKVLRRGSKARHSHGLSSPGETETAWQVARKHAPLLIDSLPREERDFFNANFQRPELALRFVEGELRNRLVREDGQAPLTIEQAVQEVRSQIAEDFRKEQEAERSRHTDDPTEREFLNKLIDGDEEERNSEYPII